MQRLRRKYVANVATNKKLRRVEWQDFKLRQVVVIQSVIRSFLARKVFKHRLAAGRRIVQAGRMFLIKKYYQKLTNARIYHTRKLLFKMIVAVKVHVGISKQFSKLKVKQVRQQINFHKKRWVFQILARIYRETLDKRRDNHAMVLWEFHLLNTIIRHWKTVIFETRRRNLILIAMLTQCIPLTALNSRRQIARLKMAQHFCTRRILVLAWTCLSDDRIRGLKADLLLPKAIAHFTAHFNKRMLTITYSALNSYAITKRIKRAAILKAAEARIWFLKSQLRPKFSLYLRRVKFMKLAFSDARLSWIWYKNAKSFREKFPAFMKRCKKLKLLAKKGDEFNMMFMLNLGMKGTVVYVKRRFEWKEMNKKAERMRNDRYYKLILAAWNTYMKYVRDAAAFVTKKYLLKICAKIIMKLQENVVANKAYVAELQRMLEEQWKREKQEKDAFEDEKSRELADATMREQLLAKFTKGLILTQACIRRTLAVKKYAKTRVTKLFAIQTIQNFVRRGLALKKFKDLVRKRILREGTSELKELDAMKQADKESSYYEYVIRCVIHMQDYIEDGEEEFMEVKLLMKFLDINRWLITRILFNIRWLLKTTRRQQHIVKFSEPRLL